MIIRTFSEMQRLCKIVDFAAANRDISFILECLEWNIGSQLTICRLRVWSLSQARWLTTAMVQWTSTRSEARLWQLSTVVVWKEIIIIDPLSQFRHTDRDRTESNNNNDDNVAAVCFQLRGFYLHVPWVKIILIVMITTVCHKSGRVLQINGL